MVSVKCQISKFISFLFQLEFHSQWIHCTVMKLVRICTNIFVLPSHLLCFNVNTWEKTCLTAARVQFAINKIWSISMVCILIFSMSNVIIHYESYSVEIWSVQPKFWYGSLLFSKKNINKFIENRFLQIYYFVTYS